MTAVARSSTSGGGLDLETRKALYEEMVLSRVFETEAERQYKAAKIGGYCHLSTGQEAATIGAMHALTADDLLVTGYRCHGFALARGLSPESVMAELFGREGGCANGRGGSMHLLDTTKGFYGGWGIVAGQLPVATGLALGLVCQKKTAAVICELGDGAVNMGAFHEALNLASLWRLPIVFMIINNLYGMGTAVERASAEPELYRRAAAYRMIGERIDGDDLDTVYETTDRLMTQARENRVPAVLEAVTYRFRGHSVADAGLAYRTKDEIAQHQEHDPIVRVRAQLTEAGVGQDELDAVDKRADERVEAAVKFADESPEPPVDQLAAGMYAHGSDEQFARMRAGSAFGEEELTFDAGLGR